MPGEFAQQRSFGFFEYQAVDERMPLSGVEAIEGANQLDTSLDLMRPQPCATSSFGGAFRILGRSSLAYRKASLTLGAVRG
jgi:hypothetical protein